MQIKNYFYCMCLKYTYVKTTTIISEVLIYKIRIKYLNPTLKTISKKRVVRFFIDEVWGG